MGKTACRPVCPYERSPRPDYILSTFLNEVNNITNFENRMDDIRSRLDELERSAEEDRRLRRAEEQRHITSYAKDLFTKLIAQIYENRGVILPTIFSNAGEDVDVATCYIQAAESITEAEFRAVTDLPLEYFKLIKSYPQNVKAGDEVGFETGGSFAQLLIKERWKDGPHYQRWVPLLEYCYGKNVREIAEEEEKLWKEMYEDLKTLAEELVPYLPTVEESHRTPRD